MDRSNHLNTIQDIKNKFNVDTVYSYSQIKCFEDDPYEYLLKYILNIEPDKEQESAYGLCGGLVHDILEKFYKNEIRRSDCKKLFEEGYKEIMTKDSTIKFSDDELTNRLMSDRYQLDIVDYFKRVNKLEGKVLCEEPIGCLLEDGNQRAAFMGYIDFLNFGKDDKIYIIDYKTSSMYKESDIPKYKQQLLLYAKAVKQKYGKKYSDIVVGWNFLKYAKVTCYVDMSEEIVERSKLNEYDPSLYVVSDCIVTVDFNEKSDDIFTSDMLSKVKHIEDMTEKYNKTKDDKPFSYVVSTKDLFRLNNFCGYSDKLHKPLREYLERENGKK